MKCPLLPLVGLVAFPHTPPVQLAATLGRISDGEKVGLVHRKRDGTLASIGTLATARVEATEGESCVLACEGISRIRIIETADDGSSCVYEPHEDVPAANATADEALCDDVRRRLSDLAALQETEFSIDRKRGESAEEFSLAVAGILEHESESDALALLEGSSTEERLRALDARLEEAVRFASTQRMLASLGSSFS